MFNKLLYLFGLVIAIFLASAANISAALQTVDTGKQNAGIVQTSPGSSVYCTGGMIYMILVIDADGIKPVSVPIGTPCTPESLATVPGGEPGIFTDPSQGFVVPFTDDPLWTGKIVERCVGPTLVTVKVFEGTKPSYQYVPYSKYCPDVPGA